MVISEIKEILLDFCEYPDFIKTDMNSSKQKDILFKLLNLTHHYKQKGILSSKTPSNFVYTTVYSRQYFHKLHLLKLSLIDDTPLEKNFQINLQFCNVLNYIFILAMLKNKTQLVKFLLDSGFPKSINSSIFNTEMTPTYFMLSCVLKNNMYNLFLNYSPNHNITWNGLSKWNFITTRQYELIYSPEIIQYSNFCFVFCTNFAILKILTIYSIDFKQSYGKLTPLHVSTYTGDLNMLLTFLIKTKNLDVQDEKGYTCLHIAALHKQYILLELLIRCGGNVNIKDNNNETVKQIYEKDNWIMKKPNVLDNELIVNLVDMDANDIGFKCSSIALDHITQFTNLDY
ncbi:ankyrin repeat protein [Vairimorpha apis BRL 01]|uniref:Ankyrin repeat protein n=1 Tax=Vairimorpha apis BRL 01 TaxID=1037528 RepID=T0LCE5_9MICR|nr:ankyrin repeat protein [Vairimorpha apis BRL 01]